MEEKRRYQRTQISFPVECNLLIGRGYFCSVSKDLSLVGIRILSNQFIPRDNIIKVNVNLIDNLVSLKAKVVWCSKNRSSERYSLGLEFLEGDADKRRNISHFLKNTNPAQ
ncbi:MAG: PilZ domain-containing protein [Candidatus Omnitrophica bacterium]|nr:PilZ domain-containing protein [Candidatus Omnitrophota bacterium]